jgi:hypothetical protein
MNHSRVDVENNIPIPEPAGQNRWPFNAMNVGESFVVPDRWRGSIVAAVYGYWNKRGKKFSVRKVNGERRCWRIE